MIEIVVLQRGFIVVGDIRRDGVEIEIHNPAIIRRHNTESGLTGVAKEGPARCILDRGDAPIRCHELTTIMRLECNQIAWKDYRRG